MFFINFPLQSNRASFTTICEMKDQMTGDLIDMSDIDLNFRIVEDNCVRLEATKDNGKIILIPDYVGYFQISFSDSEMRCLCAGTYQCRLIASRDGTTRDVFAGNLPIEQD